MPENSSKTEIALQYPPSLFSVFTFWLASHMCCLPWVQPPAACSFHQWGLFLRSLHVDTLIHLMCILWLEHKSVTHLLSSTDDSYCFQFFFLLITNNKAVTDLNLCFVLFGGVLFWENLYWAQTVRVVSSFPCLLSVGIISVCHQDQLFLNAFKNISFLLLCKVN